MNLIQLIVRHPVFSVVFTALVYWPALALHRRWRWIPPIIATCVPIVVLLLLVREPIAEYNRGGSFLVWFLGPATVGLAVPMYRHGMALKKSLPKLILIVFLGSVAGMASAGISAWLLGATRPVVMSTVPKSVTTPIAVEVCKELNGIPQITVAMVIVAGLLGASFGKPLLKLVGVHDDRAIGAAIGTGSHGIGTAALVRESERQATVSSWAMAAAGVFTSLLAPFLKLFLR